MPPMSEGEEQVNAGLEALIKRVKELEAFAKNIRDNYDHEGRRDCDPGCRVCQAEEVIGVRK